MKNSLMRDQEAMGKNINFLYGGFSGPEGSSGRIEIRYQQDVE